MSLRAGKLRHRLVIEAPGTTRDPATGAMIHGWATVATVWGAVEPLSAREFIAAQAVQSGVSARITIRYRLNIDATMRIKHGGRIYNIEGVLADPVSGLEYLTMPCSEGTNDG